MSVVEIKNTDGLEKFKKGFKYMLKAVDGIKDFVIITIDKDGAIRKINTKNYLPLLTAMEFFKSSMLEENFETNYYYWDEEEIKKDE